MEGPEKIDKWLHVWSEAEQAARIKNQQRDRLGNAAGESPASRTEESGADTPIQAASLWTKRSG